MTSFNRAATLSVIAILCFFLALLCGHQKASDALVGAWGMALVIVMAAACAIVFAAAQRNHPDTQAISKSSGAWGSIAAALVALEVLTLLKGSLVGGVLLCPIVFLCGFRYRIALQEKGRAPTLQQFLTAAAVESLVLIVPIAVALLWQR